MHQRNWLTIPPTAAAILVLAGVLAMTSPAPPIAPTVVVAVNLERILNTIDALQTIKASLTQLQEDQEAQVKAKIKEARERERDLDTLAKGTPKYDEAERALLQMAMEIKALREYANVKLDFKEGEGYRLLYADVKKWLGEFAQSNGYDVVLLNDSVLEIERAGTEKVQQQISARRVLYVRPTLDVTDQAIAWMNTRVKKPA